METGALAASVPLLEVLKAGGRERITRAEEYRAPDKADQRNLPITAVRGIATPHLGTLLLKGAGCWCAARLVFRQENRIATRCEDHLSDPPPKPANESLDTAGRGRGRGRALSFPSLYLPQPSLPQSVGRVVFCVPLRREMFLSRHTVVDVTAARAPVIGGGKGRGRPVKRSRRGRGKQKPASAVLYLILSCNPNARPVSSLLGLGHNLCSILHLASVAFPVALHAWLMNNLVDVSVGAIDRLTTEQ